MNTATLEPTIAVKERPILFSGAMVRAILEGRKTQTRRVIKPQPEPHQKCSVSQLCWHPNATTYHCFNPHQASSISSAIPNRYCPYGKVGDRLWVRESWYRGQEKLWYKADILDQSKCGIAGWKPSIHMPRAASRITLEVIDVRVQQLQDISEEDAIEEGISKDEWFGFLTVKQDFQKLWDSINAAKHPWDSNPWVWAGSFQQVKTTSTLELTPPHSSGPR